MLSIEDGDEQVELKGERRTEFDVLWDVLHFRSSVNKENATFLSVWADKYQIEGLKSRAEDILVSEVPVSCIALDHAVRYNLLRRATQCATEISKDICQWVAELTSMGSQVSADTMRTLWPSLCRAAAVDVPMPDDLTPGHALWPFIAKSATVGALAAAVKEWPQGLYSHLPRGADRQAQAWVQEQLRTHGL